MGRAFPQMHDAVFADEIFHLNHLHAIQNGNDAVDTRSQRGIVLSESFHNNRFSFLGANEASLYKLYQVEHADEQEDRKNNPVKYLHHFVFYAVNPRFQTKYINSF